MDGLSSSGIYQHLLQKHRMGSNHKTFEDKQNQYKVNKAAIITFQHVFIVILVLLFGLGVSLLVLFVEFIFRSNLYK